MKIKDKEKENNITPYDRYSNSILQKAYRDQRKNLTKSCLQKEDVKELNVS